MTTAARSLLTPLVCSSCKGPTPLIEADETRCPYCSETVRIPSDYRKLAEAQRTFAAHAERVGLWKDLGRAPAWPYRLAAWYFPDASDLIYPFFFSPFVGGGFYGLFFLPLMGGVLGADGPVVYDRFPWSGLPFVFGMAFIWLAAFMGAMGKRRALALGPLQAAAAARPPERKGGQCTCRRCGSPLSYGPRDLGVRCAYCETDNLLQIPEGWARKMKGQATALVEAYEALEAQWSRHRQELSRHRWRLSAVLSALTVVFCLFVFWPDSGRRTHEWSWQRMRTESVARLFTEERNSPSSDTWWAVTKAQRLEPRTAFSMETTGTYCSERTGTCRVYVQLAVLRDEHWQVGCDVPGGEIAVWYADYDSTPPSANSRDWPASPNSLPEASGPCERFETSAFFSGLRLVAITVPGAEVGRTVGITLVNTGVKPPTVE